MGALQYSYDILNQYLLSFLFILPVSAAHHLMYTSFTWTRYDDRVHCYGTVDTGRKTRSLTTYKVHNN